jgi:hypothetical protein
MKKIIFFTILLSSFLNSFSQCAMCKAVVENSDNKMAEGINFGIIYLMIFPYLILILGLFFFFRNKKKKKSN